MIDKNTFIKLKFLKFTVIQPSYMVVFPKKVKKIELVNLLNWFVLVRIASFYILFLG